MQCLVAIKQVIDPYAVIRVKADGSGIETENVKLSMNPFDEIAVEEAVRQKEAGKLSKITVISVGSNNTQDILRQALARGVDEAILIQSEGKHSPLAIAKILAKIAAQLNVKLIMLGKQAIDDDCNQTGQMLAALLNWSQGTFVSNLIINSDNLQVARETDYGLENLQLSLPSVITTDLRLNQPRFLSLPNIMQAKSKPLTIQKLEELGITIENNIKILNTQVPKTRSAGIILNSVDELIKKIKCEAKIN